MAGPTTWEVPTESVVVSDDRKSAKVSGTMDTSYGLVAGTWGICESDPSGPIVVKVTIEGKVQRTFNFILKS